MVEEKQILGALSTPVDPTLALATSNSNNNNNNHNNDLVSVSESVAGSVASLASVFKSRSYSI